jgi:hypothetical protein
MGKRDVDKRKAREEEYAKLTVFREFVNSLPDDKWFTGAKYQSKIPDEVVDARVKNYGPAYIKRRDLNKACRQASGMYTISVQGRNANSVRVRIVQVGDIAKAELKALASELAMEQAIAKCYPGFDIPTHGLKVAWRGCRQQPNGEVFEAYFPELQQAIDTSGDSQLKALAKKMIQAVIKRPEVFIKYPG